MSLSLWTMDPFRELYRVQRDINKLFDNTWNDSSALTLAPEMKAWRPSCDIKETDGALIIHADLPGVPKENVKVDFENGVLTISGERTYEKKEEEKKEGEAKAANNNQNVKYHRIERSYGSFSRSFSLGEKVDPSSIMASYKDGVLEVTVPKPPAPQAPEPRRISVA